jgi:hypothetical protein
MLILRSFAHFCLIVGPVMTVGCGGNSGCHISAITVMPSTATVNHTSASPGNTQIFSTGFPESGDCRGVGTLVTPQINWTASDPSIHLSPQGTQVTATCTAALPNPVTITATPVPGSGFTFTGQASLTCN